MNSRKQSPFSSLITILVPLSFVVMTIWRTGIRVNWIGAVDHAAFVLFCLIVFGLIRLPESGLLRKGAAFLFIAVLSLFFITNLLYFRFFNAWFQVEQFGRWRQLPDLGSSIKDLCDKTDLLIGVLVPFLLWAVSPWAPAKISHKKTGRMIFLFTALVALQALAAPTTSSPTDSNPFLSLFRQKISQQAGDAHMEEKMRLVVANAHQYKFLNATLTRFSGSQRYPFEQVPVDHPAPSPYVFAKKPNVVIILMESFRAYETGAYGAPRSMTPSLDKLVKQGLFFTRYYSIGNQTTKAEFAALNSYLPDAYGESVYSQYHNLSIVSLPLILKHNGYKTMFIAGMAANRDTADLFMSSHGVDQFFCQVPHPKRLLGWGPSDEDILNYAFDVLSKQTEPFYASMRTLSNHFPFKDKFLPGEMQDLPGNDEDYKGYEEGIRYTDEQVGRFLERAAQTPWGKNTIFVITGDHGIWIFPENAPKDNPHREEIFFRLPLLIWSPALIKPQTIDRLGSHIDLAPTILDLLNIHAKNSFLGVSLLRDDVKERYALMLHEGRWSYRNDKEYVYDSGPEWVQNEAGAQNEAGKPSDIRFMKTGKMTHWAFRSPVDLLHDTGKIASFLPEGRAHVLEEFAEDALSAEALTLHADRVSDPRDGKEWR